MYFAGNDDYPNFIAFSPMLSPQVLDSNKKVANWISTRISSEKTKPFDTNLEPTMLMVANGKVNLKCNKSVLVQKSFSSLYINFILHL